MKLDLEIAPKLVATLVATEGLSHEVAEGVAREVLAVLAMTERDQAAYLVAWSGRPVDAGDKPELPKGDGKITRIGKFRGVPSQKPGEWDPYLVLSARFPGADALALGLIPRFVERLRPVLTGRQKARRRSKACRGAWGKLRERGK